MTDLLAKDVDKLLIDTLEHDHPGLMNSIRTLKRAGESNEKILAHCKRAGAKGFVLLAIEAELDRED